MVRTWNSTDQTLRSATSRITAIAYQTCWFMTIHFLENLFCMSAHLVSYWWWLSLLIEMQNYLKIKENQHSKFEINPKYSQYTILLPNWTLREVLAWRKSHDLRSRYFRAPQLRWKTENQLAWLHPHVFCCETKWRSVRFNIKTGWRDHHYKDKLCWQSLYW